MTHLIPLPFILLGVIVFFVADSYKLKIFKTISKFVIAIATAWFVYEYLKYLGYDIIEIILNFLK